VNFSNPMLGKEEIATLIPHAGDMCLLDGVVRWNEDGISCVSASHRRLDNPLRVQGRLPAVSGIEYAAQAMAVHGALAGNASRPRAGYLASVRDAVFFYRDLDGLEGELTVDAKRLMGDAERVLYEFTLRIGGVEVISGRAAVVLDVSTSTE
jgi:predicted hotdog family 3-hydroxylacyl-ACP dehydratase